MSMQFTYNFLLQHLDKHNFLNGCKLKIKCNEIIQSWYFTNKYERITSQVDHPCEYITTYIQPEYHHITASAITSLCIAHHRVAIAYCIIPTTHHSPIHNTMTASDERMSLMTIVRTFAHGSYVSLTY